MFKLEEAIREEFYLDIEGYKVKLFIFKCDCCGGDVRKTKHYINKSKTRYCRYCVKKNTLKSRNLPEKQTCRVCKQEHLINEFYIRPETNLPRSECKKCINLKNNFHINANHYNKMLQEQNNSCAICHSEFSHKHQNGKDAKLAVDHCHSTGQIRGLLCSKCNIGLGLFKDNEDLLKNAILYLDKYKGLKCLKNELSQEKSSGVVNVES